MVRIRYSELPVGLHVTAVAVGRQTIVYLLPGLTAAERKSALLRVRCSARVGHGPSMPRFALAEALAADRLRAVLHTVSAAVRRHPVLLIPFVALILSVTVLAVVSGTAGATPGHLSGPASRTALSSPPGGRFVVHPAPLARRHHHLRILSRHDLTPLSLPLTLASIRHRAAGHHSSGRRRFLQHRADHRWRLPAPCHIGIAAAPTTVTRALVSH